MPFVFLAAGVLFIIVAINGTQGVVFGLLKDEFFGTNAFLPWVAALLILGVLSYIPVIRPIAVGMIILVVTAMVLANKGGVFKQFNNAIRNPAPPPSAG